MAKVATMVEVGIKDLKDGLSGYLRRVARGEHIRVTSRGKPIADLIPAEPAGAEDPELLRLEMEGRITLSRLPKPRRSPTPAKLPRSASGYILDERDAER